MASPARSRFAPPRTCCLRTRGAPSGPRDLSARIDFVAPRAVALRDIVLSTDVVRAQGSLSIDQQSVLATDLTGQLRDLGLFVERIQAPADFNLSASGPLDALETTLNLSIEKGEAAGYRIEDIALQLDGIASQVAPSGNLKVSGRIDGKPLEAAARIESADGQTKVDALDLAIGPNRATGALDLGRDFLPTGKVSFDFPDLSLLAALAGQTVGGDLKGEVAITSSGGKIAADIEAREPRSRRIISQSPHLGSICRSPTWPHWRPKGQ